MSYAILCVSIVYVPTIIAIAGVVIMNERKPPTKIRRIVTEPKDGVYELELPDEEGRPKFVDLTYTKLIDLLDWLDNVEIERQREAR